jgi:hypothetical protein
MTFNQGLGNTYVSAQRCGPNGTLKGNKVTICLSKIIDQVLIQTKTRPIFTNTYIRVLTMSFNDLASLF